MKAYQKRVKRERLMLGLRLEALNAFLRGKVAAGLCEQELTLLETQAMAMTLYALALDKRLALFAEQNRK